MSLFEITQAMDNDPSVSIELSQLKKYKRSLMEEQGYYWDEVRKIDTKSEYAPTIQIRNGEKPTQTKWMNLNRDSAEVLVKWLKEQYNLK